MNENPTNADEQLELGDKYYYGRGVPKDLERAVYWYTKAAEQGQIEAQFYLGDSYYNGKGVPRDLERAVYWYTKAAEQGHILSQRNVGNYYRRGDCGPTDMTKAAYWYAKAAEQGDSMSQYNLGVYYYKGDPFPKDLEKARYWANKAAKQGDVDAKALLKKLGYKNSRVAKYPSSVAGENYGGKTETGNISKTEIIEKEKVTTEDPLKRLQYIDELQGYFSRDFSIMRDEYVSLAEILKDEEIIKHCNKRAVEYRQEYNRLAKEEEPGKNKKKRKSTIGTILQLVTTIAFSIALWSTDYIHAIWNSNNYLYKLLPLGIFSLLMGIICALLCRNSRGTGLGLLLGLYAGIAQLITGCVWVFAGNFKFFNFIGYLIIHAILIFIVLIPGWIISYIRSYNEDEIASTIVKNPSKTDVKKYDEMINRHKKVYGNNHAEIGVVYHNLGAVYTYFNENDIALEYYQNALEAFLSVHGEEHLNTAQAYYKIGLVFNNLDNTEKALEYYRKALKVREKLLPQGHEAIINTSEKIKAIDKSK